MTSQTSSNDAFDDDDSEEFEMLLSQIDIPKVPTPKRPSSFKQTIVTRQTVPATASRVVQPSGPPKPVLAPPQPPKPVLTQPSNSKVNTNLVRHFLLASFKLQEYCSSFQSGHTKIKLQIQQGPEWYWTSLVFKRSIID
jgi:hypothetical protein